MGIIQRQTFKNSILSGVGIAIGLFSNLYIYPLNLEIKGLAETIIKMTMLLAPPLLLGVPTVMVRFRPYVVGENRNSLLLGRALLIVTSTLATTALFLFLLGGPLLSVARSSGWALPLLEEYRWSIIGIVAASVYATILTTHALNAHRIAMPVVFRDLFLKLGTPILVYLVVIGQLTKTGFVAGLVLLFWLGTLGLFIYINSIGIGKMLFSKFSFKGVSRKDIYSLAAYSLLGTLGSRMTIVVDTLSVSFLIGKEETGIYSFAIFVCSVILVPYRAVDAIARPIIAQAWKDKDYDKIGFLYRETASVLFAVGALIYVGAVVCVPYLYLMTDKPVEMSLGYTSLIILGAAQLFDLMTSINGSILGYSKYYRWNIYLLLFLGFLMVIGNFIFIGLLDFGITGAALGTMMAMVLYNTGKVVLLWWKMKIHPFSASMLWTSASLAGLGIIAWSLPVSQTPVFDILIRGTIITVPFLLLVRNTNMLPEVRKMMLKGPKDMFK